MKKRFLKKQLSLLPGPADYIITAGVLAGAWLLSLVMIRFDGDHYIHMVYVLAVVIISRYTNGYLCGLIASVVSMLCANLVVYPYFRLDFSMASYPITFAVMLLVSTFISMLTTRLKEQSMINAEMEKEKIRGNLLRAVSHDIRTPLTSVSGAASAILENYEKISREDTMSLVNDIKEDTDWLIRMIENILTVTRIGDETGSIKKTPEAAEEVIGEIIVKFRKKYDVAVNVDIPSELVMIPMDAVLIEQVLFNLLENCVIHGKTTTKITIHLETDEDNAVFSVIDNGMGINEKQLPVIFDGYLSHTDEKTGADRKRNMGIGLSACAAIIKIHGGVISAHNNPAGGACLKFTLPLT